MFVLMTNITKGTCQHLECFLSKDKPVETYVSFDNLTADQLERVFAIIQPFRDEIEAKEQAKVDKAQARLEKAEAILAKKVANAEKAAAKKKGPKVRVGAMPSSARARDDSHSSTPPSQASKKAAAHADSDTDTEEPVAKKKAAKKPMTPEQVRAANP